MMAAARTTAGWLRLMYYPKTVGPAAVLPT
jgi:hypothetical protein